MANLLRTNFFMVLAIFGLVSTSSEAEPLTLRVSDAMGQPGERIAVVLRTYAPRTVSQGQICLRARINPPETEGAFQGSPEPFSALEEVVVFSEEGDAIALGSFDDTSQVALLELSSPSATVNGSDGPMAVFFFRLDSQLTPGDVIELDLELADTFLVDPEGEPIELELRAGELEIRAPDEARTLEAEGDEGTAGEPVVLSVSTSELFPIAAGQASLRFDPSLVEALISVRIDPRYGHAFWEADGSVPGRVLVAFNSPDLTLNTVPGEILQVEVLLAEPLEVGSVWPVHLEAAETWLEGADGMSMSLELGQDFVEIVPAEGLFADGFETGDLTSWSDATP